MSTGVIVHRVHFYSSIYPVRKSGCSLCHLTPESNTRSSVALCGSCHGEMSTSVSATGSHKKHAQSPLGKSCSVCHGAGYAANAAVAATHVNKLIEISFTAPAATNGAAKPAAKRASARKSA